LRRGAARGLEFMASVERERPAASPRRAERRTQRDVRRSESALLR
jgi:hypothetical protein